jgi:NAD(P)-dependent dehydrogenase (short-subunit alcohol dehydrogenase family)
MGTVISRMPTILITGATDGLGRHVARDLARQGWTVLAHGRSPEKVQRVVEETGGRGYVADLASLADVRRLAGEVLENEPRLDVLCNNAGIGFGAPDGEREESADGLELRFAVNYLSHFELTLRLLDRLRESAPARIVNVASAGQYPLDFDDLQFERGWDGTTAYRKSKLAQILFTLSLAERLGDDGVTVTALHPATFMGTNMVLQSGIAPHSEIAEGARATERLIADPELAGVTGRYFNGLREADPDPQALDPEARERLWRLSESLVS